MVEGFFFGNQSNSFIIIQVLWKLLTSLFLPKPFIQEALRSVEEKIQNVKKDGTPISEGRRLMVLAEIHLKMHCVTQAEEELVNALTLLLEYSNDLLRRGNAIPDYIPRILFHQEYRSVQITILQTCIKAANILSGICECAGRKKDAKRYDKISLQLQEYLRKETDNLSEPQLIPMKVVGTDFLSVHMSSV